jgi:hypothetical protein
MAFVRFSLGAFLVLGYATACSSSSTAPGGPADASTSSEEAGDANNPLGLMGTCGAIGMLAGDGGGSCPSGQTCCTVLALPPSSSCVPEGTCTGISTVCSKGSDCTGGQVCCAGSADAGVPAADAGMQMFDPSTLSTTCQTSCTASQAQYCSTDTDCPSGLTCQSLGGGAGGGLFNLPSFCAMPRPDAGTIGNDAGPVADSGSPPDTLPDTGTADAPAE